MKKTDREVVDDYWEYSEKIVLKMLELCKQLCKDAFLHGLKYGREECE